MRTYEITSTQMIELYKRCVMRKSTRTVMTYQGVKEKELTRDDIMFRAHAWWWAFLKSTEGKP